MEGAATGTAMAAAAAGWDSEVTVAAGLEEAVTAAAMAAMAAVTAVELAAVGLKGVGMVSAKTVATAEKQVAEMEGK